MNLLVTLLWRLGINPSSNLVIEGDRNLIDASKLSKHMSSGEFRSGAGIVERQAKWPHEMLNALACGDSIPKTHWDLDRPQFVCGMIGKILGECPEAELNTELANKLLFLNIVIGMSFNVNWQQILRVSSMAFSVYEMQQLEWSSWDILEKYLERAQNRARLMSSILQAHCPWRWPTCKSR